MKFIFNEILCPFIWISTNEIQYIMWQRFPWVTKQGVLYALRKMESEGLVVRKSETIRSRNGLKNLSWKKS